VTIRRAGGWVAGALTGFAAGVALTLSLQGGAAIPEHAPTPAPPTDEPFATIRERADTFLAWTPAGLPSGFADALKTLPGVRRSVLVASNVVWLTRSYADDGSVVDDPPDTFSIPLEAAAVDPEEYAPFLPPSDRALMVELAQGAGILGETSAKLRGLGPGAVLRFGRVRVPIAGILPDELVGAHEVLVSRETGRRLGVTRDRYALFVPRGEPTVRGITTALKQELPLGTLVRVRAPGDTPYFRHGDAVLPPVELKELFGEFAAKQRAGANAGFLTFDPRWVRTHIDTQRVPLLGTVTCNVAMFPQVRGAIRELIDLGLEDTITSYSGCWAPRHILGDPDAGLSHHGWGVAIDVNVPTNLFGQDPNQDPRMVEVFERWGFIWGGDFIQPDGMHFEYRRPPEPS
jgi:hypothetical protein